MPQLHVAPPTAPQRLLNVAEVGRHETCPLMWWYDQHHPLAGAGTDDLQRRQEILAAVYGPAARDLPEFRLLTDLLARTATPPATKPPPTRAAPTGPVVESGGLLALVVIVAAIIVGLVLAGVVFAALQP